MVLSATLFLTSPHSHQLYIVVVPQVMYLRVGKNCNPIFLNQVLGVPSYAAVPDNLVRGKKSCAFITYFMVKKC